MQWKSSKGKIRVLLMNIFFSILEENKVLIMKTLGTSSLKVFEVYK